MARSLLAAMAAALVSAGSAQAELISLIQPLDLPNWLRVEATGNLVGPARVSIGGGSNAEYANLPTPSTFWITKGPLNAGEFIAIGDRGRPQPFPNPDLFVQLPIGPERAGASFMTVDFGALNFPTSWALTISSDLNGGSSRTISVTPSVGWLAPEPAGWLLAASLCPLIVHRASNLRNPRRSTPPRRAASRRPPHSQSRSGSGSVP